MTEAEFVSWQVYAARWQLPARRVDLHLAQIAQLQAVANTREAQSLTDFLFDPRTDAVQPDGEEPDDADIAAMRAALGFDATT